MCTRQMVTRRPATIAADGQSHLVGTYDNPGYTELQFMLSSPYTNYANGSDYDGLKIVSPEDVQLKGDPAMLPILAQTALTRTITY